MDLIYKHINEIAIESTSSVKHSSVFFLTPCHQLPFYSFIHNPNVKMGFLDCSPQLRPTILNQGMVSDYQRINQTIFSPSWRQRFWEDPVEVLDLLFPLGLEDGSLQDSPGTADVYIDPSNQLYTRHTSWFGGLTTSGQLKWVSWRYNLSS